MSLRDKVVRAVKELDREADEAHERKSFIEAAALRKAVTRIREVLGG